MTRTTWQAALAALTMAAGSGAALAQSAATAQPAASAAASSGAPAGTLLQGPVVAVQTLSMTGKLTAVDPARRQLEVKGQDGRVATVVAGPQVRNFDKLKLGDQVTMRYTQAQSLAIAKGGVDTDAELGEIRTKVESQSARQAPSGGKPGVSAIEQTVMVANVFRIDRQAGVLTLRGTSGEPVEVKVDKAALEQIQLDDQIVIGYRQAMAVSVEPAGTAMGSGTAPR